MGVERLITAELGLSEGIAAIEKAREASSLKILLRPEQSCGKGQIRGQYGERERETRLALAAYGILALVATFTLDGVVRTALWIFFIGLAAKTVSHSKDDET